MERKISVTAACNAANHCVRRPVQSGQTSWQVLYHEPEETATRVMQANSYPKALVLMTLTKVFIALRLLGESWGYQWDDGPDINVYKYICDGMSWKTAVKQAHKQAIAQ